MRVCGVTLIMMALIRGKYNRRKQLRINQILNNAFSMLFIHWAEGERCVRRSIIGVAWPSIGGGRGIYIIVGALDEPSMK